MVKIYMEFILVVLPAFIILAIGYIGQKKIKIDRKSVSVTALYLMYPFLAFRTFYTNELTVEYLYILLFCLSLCFSLLIIVLTVSRLRKLGQTKTSAVILSGVFMNSGNYGTPIILFALILIQRPLWASSSILMRMSWRSCPFTIITLGMLS